MSYYRTMTQMSKAQLAYDEMLPPEYWEDDPIEVEKTCLYCDKVLEQSEYETKYNYQKRDHCNKTCAALRRKNKARGRAI